MKTIRRLKQFKKDVKGYRDCHIEPDWLLIYQSNETEWVFLVPKLRLGMPSSTLRVEPSILCVEIHSGTLCVSQRGALREGIPKRSLGTRDIAFFTTIVYCACAN